MHCVTAILLQLGCARNEFPRAYNLLQACRKTEELVHRMIVQAVQYLVSVAPCRVIGLQLRGIMGKGASTASLATTLLIIYAHTRLE